MLQLSSSLIDIPVLSLRTGGVVATAEKMIINPNNLKIEGWFCKDYFSKNTLILLVQDIRETLPQGFAIDDYERLADPEDIIRLREVLEINFELIGKQVMTENKRKVGKLTDFSTDMGSFYIQKLYVHQPMYKNLSGGQLSIDRTQIIEINNRRIVVKDTEQKLRSIVPASLGAN